MFKNVFSAKRLFFSERLRNFSHAKKIATVAVFTALSVVANMFLEMRILDIQFSLTIFFSAITGYFLGPLAGFFACLSGDFIGYVFNSWGQLYLPWVGLSTGLFAFIAGLMFGDEGEQPFRKQIVKFLIYVALTFCICTVMINTTGFYFYFKYIYVSKKFLAYAEEHFGGNGGYFIYLIYRLFVNGQIWNSIANYALLFAFFPVLKKIPFLRLHDNAEE